MNDELAETAEDCVKKAGDILLGYHNRLNDLQIEVKGRFDYVTEADLAAQEAIVNLIHSRHPEHEILAEEGSRSPGQNASRWLVDPLDGTNNFIHGFPVFAVSVALEHENSIVLGAIYETDFKGFTYGFRPGRSAHDALDALHARGSDAPIP